MQATKAPRKRKPLQPVTGRCRWIVQPGIAPCPHPGVIEITVVRPSDGTEVTEAYAVHENRDDGRLAGYQLKKADGTKYDLPADFSSCDCADGTYSPDRPGGCKHRKALPNALASL
jgi:hypothetical protein